ncbi:MAG: hypothetical protein AAGE65_08650 [Planctomycetota bacterium]
MSAIADLQPGKSVTFTVTAAPTNAAATKTLVRLLSKDPAAAKRNARIKKNRLSNPTFSPRGGRWRVWEHRQPKKFVVHGKPGESATIVAGVQELRDLASVERFVDVKAA